METRENSFKHIVYHLENGTYVDMRALAISKSELNDIMQSADNADMHGTDLQYAVSQIIDEYAERIASLCDEMHENIINMVSNELSS